MREPKLEQVSFAQGIISDASPVATPEGAILRACNYDIQKNGSAFLRPPLRREGVTAFASAAGTQYAYVWDAPDGDTTKQLLVMQVGTTFKLLLRAAGVNSAVTDVTPGSADHARGILATGTVSGVLSGATIHATSTQKYCIISGISITSSSEVLQECVLIIEYRRETGDFSAYFDYIWVRDFFGYEDGRVNGERTSYSGTIDDSLMYNLFNQGWGEEASGTAPNKYVLRSFVSSLGADVDAICTSYTSGGTADEVMAIDGVLSTSGGWSGTPQRVTLSSTLAATFKITGVTQYGVTTTETVNTAISTRTAAHFASISAVTVTTTAGVQCSVGVDNLLPGDYDNWTLGVYQATATTRSWNSNFLTQVPDGAGKAPSGHYIIPVNYRSTPISAGGLGRGGYLSRVAQVWYDVSWTPALDDDRTGRPNKLCTFGGRVWYSMTRANCSNETSHGNSPDIGSYICFSRLIDNISDLTSCYQTNDPTSPEFNELLPDDGGFIRIQGAGEIVGLRGTGTGVLVFGTLGVWHITGGSDSVFTAEAFVVRKLTDEGCVAPDSIVNIQDSSAYVTAAGINLVGNTEGGMSVQSLTEGKNETLFNSFEDIESCKAVYDSAYRRAHFLFKVSGAYKKELVFDVSLGCVYTRVYVPGSYAIQGYLPHATSRVQEFSSGERCPNYGYVLCNGTNVYIGYIRYDDVDGADYDWEDEGGDYASSSEIFIGHVSAGDLRMKKFCSYLESFLERTESTYTVTSGEAALNHESSCKVEAFWEWADTAGSQYKGQEFQVYMYRRPYLAASADGTYTFDYGQSVISTQTRLRGNGKTLALRFFPEANKDCRLLGWCISVRGV